MSDQEPPLPERLRSALKDKSAFTPPESFYTNVLRKVRATPEPRSRWAWIWDTPMRLAATTAIIMISYFAMHDKSPWGPQKAGLVYDQVSPASQARAFDERPAERNEVDAARQTPPNSPAVLSNKATEAKDMKMMDSLHDKIAKKAPAEQRFAIVTNASKPSASPAPLVENSAVRFQSADSNLPVSRGQLAGGMRSKSAEGATFPWQSRAQADQVTTAASVAARRDFGVRAAPVGNLKEENGLALEKMTRQHWRGTDSAIRDFRTIAIATPKDWDLFWQTHELNQLPPVSLPAVDFDRSMVVGVLSGTRPDLAAVDIVDVQVMADQLLVTYREIPLAPGQGVRGATNCPYEFRVVPKTVLPVHFQKIN